MKEKITTMPTKETLKRWEKLTWDNCHDECLIEIANWLYKASDSNYFKMIRDGFQYILDEHIIIGHLTNELNILRYCATNEMMNRAKNMFDKKVFDAIIKCQ